MKPLKSDLCTQEFDKNIFCHDNNYIYIAFNRTKIKMAKSPYPHSLKIFLTILVTSCTAVWNDKGYKIVPYFILANQLRVCTWTVSASIKNFVK